MVFKKKIYNVIFIIMLMFVIGAFGLSTYVIATAPTIVSPDAGDSEDNNPNNPGDNDPSYPQNPGDINPDNPNNPDLDFDPNVPSHRYPLKVLNYALDKMFSSDGYRANYSVKMDIDAMLLGSAITIKQTIDGYVEQSGDKAYEDFVYSATGPASNGAANYLRKLYIDGDKLYHMQTPNNVFDASAYGNTEYTRESYNARFGFALVDKPILDFTKEKFNTSIVTQVDKNGVEYYVLTATGIDKDSWPAEFMRFFESTGALKQVRVENASYTFHIYKNNAQIFKIQIDGNIVGVNPGTGIDLVCRVAVNETVTAYNQKIEVTNPLDKKEE